MERGYEELSNEPFLGIHDISPLYKCDILMIFGIIRLHLLSPQGPRSSASSTSRMCFSRTPDPAKHRAMQELKVAGLPTPGPSVEKLVARTSRIHVRNGNLFREESPTHWNLRVWAAKLRWEMTLALVLTDTFPPQRWPFLIPCPWLQMLPVDPLGWDLGHSS